MLAPMTRKRVSMLRRWMRATGDRDVADVFAAQPADLANGAAPFADAPAELRPDSEADVMAAREAWLPPELRERPADDSPGPAGEPADSRWLTD
jgi:hypothetical protein